MPISSGSSELQGRASVLVELGQPAEEGGAVEADRDLLVAQDHARDQAPGKVRRNRVMLTAHRFSELGGCLHEPQHVCRAQPGAELPCDPGFIAEVTGDYAKDELLKIGRRRPDPLG